MQHTSQLRVTKKYDMQKQITVLQFLLGIIAMFMSIIGMYSMNADKIKNNAEEAAKTKENFELRIKFQEMKSENYEKKLDAMSGNITTILLLLKDKQDRK